MSANSVLPPVGLTTRADSSEYFAGTARNELSECQSMFPRLNRRARASRGSGWPSRPRLETSFMPIWRRLSSGLVMLPPRASSSAPKLRLNAICCSSVIFWSGNTSTAYRSIPASIAATSSAVSALPRSTPDTSPTNTGWIWRMDIVIANSLPYPGRHTSVLMRWPLSCGSCEPRHQLHRLGLFGRDRQPGDAAVGPGPVALADTRDGPHQRHLVAELVGDRR